MRLWSQLALVMALLAVVPAAVLGGLAISTVDTEWRRTSELRVRRDARHRAGELGDWLAARRELVRDLPASFALEGADLTADHETSLLVLVYRVVSDVELAIMVDGDGRQVGPPVPGDVAAADIEALRKRLPAARASRQTTTAHVGSAWASPAGPSVPLAVHVADGADGPRILGVQLRMPVDRGGAGDPQGIGLLDETGAPLVVGGPLVKPGQLAPLLGVFEEFEIDDPEPAHGALATVDGSPGWTFVVVEPEQALLRLSERITGQILVMAILATVVGLLAAFGMAL
ncbi:MAG: hypothetical protein AAF211_26325, partial [Myxococcota bacterium]